MKWNQGYLIKSIRILPSVVSEISHRVAHDSRKNRWINVWQV